MGKKQRERKEKKLAQRPQGATPPSWLKQDMSPEAIRAIEKIAKVNPNQNERLFMNALMDSHKWRDEPEFQDWHFNADKATQVLNAIMPSYQSRLERAAKQGEEELQTAYDDLRIEAIDKLLSPEKRKDFVKRFDTFLSRLMQGHDGKKIENALVIRTILDQREFPWGAIGLVTTIFDEVRTKALGQFNQAEDLMVKMLREENPDVSEQELRAMIQDPTKIKELENRIKIPEALREEVEGMTDQLLDDFTNEVFAGEVELELFTPEELEHLAERINAFVTVERTDEQAELNAEAMARLMPVISSFIQETMTEERIDQMDHDLGEIEQEWEAAGNLQCAFLEILRGDLHEFEPKENRFLYSALLGQLRRAEKEAMDQDKDENEAETRPTEIIQESTPAQPNLRTRIGNVFKRNKN